MKKEQRYLEELENKLEFVSKRDRNAIILKYKKIIAERKENKEKIIKILKDLGPVNEVAEKEILEYKKTRSAEYNINKFFSKFKKKKENKKNKKKLEKKEKKTSESFFDKFKRNKTDKKEKRFFKEFFNKFKIKKEKTLKEEVEETIEDAHDEIGEVAEIVTEKKIFETKEQRNKRIALKVINVIITIILLFIWLWITVIFIASLFAFLDGVKFYGLVIGLFGLDTLFLFIILLINKSLFRRRINRKHSFIAIIVCILIIAIGIALAFRQIYKLNITTDVNEKYNMTKKTSTYNLPSDIEKKIFISFNANYKTEYIVDYDNTLSDKVNVEVKYYECYYDYFVKKDNNNIYISLALDNRDRLSVYIDDFKEGKIYSNKEFERYVVKITMNEKDKDRVVIK